MSTTTSSTSTTSTNNNSKYRIVQFESRKDEIDGFYELLVHKPQIRAVGEHKFMISKEQCKLLKSKDIKYKVLE